MYGEKELQRIYNESYFKTRYPRPEMWTNRAKFLISKFSPKKVLDVGCSTGLLVKALVDHGIDAYGVEGSDYALSQVHPSIKDRVKKVNFESDVMPFADSSFDLITGFYVTEHIHAIDHFAEEMHRILVKGGIAWFITPDGDRQGGRNEADVNTNTFAQWKEIFEKHGFKVRKSSHYGFMTLRGRLGFLQLYRLPEPFQTWAKIAIYKVINQFITKELSFIIVK
jgi:SAM-dependent methyltransferase